MDICLIEEWSEISLNFFKNFFFYIATYIQNNWRSWDFLSFEVLHCSISNFLSIKLFNELIFTLIIFLYFPTKNLFILSQYRMLKRRLPCHWTDWIRNRSSFIGNACTINKLASNSWYCQSNEKVFSLPTPPNTFD